MFSHVIVICDEQCGHTDCSGEAFESGARPGVELVSPVEPLDKLFESTIFRACFICVFESHNGFTMDNVDLAFLVVCVDCGIV